MFLPEFNFGNGRLPAIVVAASDVSGAFAVTLETDCLGGDVFRGCRNPSEVVWSAHQADTWDCVAGI